MKLLLEQSLVMCIQSIRLILPFCDTSQEKQTKCSLILRTMAVGLGAIALLIGVLILCGIPGLSTLGTTGGSLFSTLGALMIPIGACLRCIKERNQINSTNPMHTSNIAPHDVKEPKKDAIKLEKPEARQKKIAQDKKFKPSKGIPKNRSKAPENPIVESARSDNLGFNDLSQAISSKTKPVPKITSQGVDQSALRGKVKTSTATSNNLSTSQNSAQDLPKTKEFIYDDCFSIKAILFLKRAIHRENQAKYVNKFAALQEKFLKLLKLNDISALEKRFQELYNDKEMHTDIMFFTKAKNEVWVDDYVLETMWLFYCKDEELFDLPLSKLTVYDTNQKKVLGHRINMTRGSREEQWKQSWASSPPKEGTIGSLFASDPEAFKFKNLIQE